MEISPPCIITPRLLPGVQIGDSFLSIEYGGKTSEGRTKYRMFLDTPTFEYSDTELCGGCGGGSLQDGLESLLSFMAACGESVAYGRRTGSEGENASLYPRHVAEWCYANSDELSLLGCELEDSNGDVIVE